MEEDLDLCGEEPLASMWPPDIEDKSNMQFNIEKPNLTEENLLKEFKSEEEKHKLDFRRLTELTDYSDIGSHQLTGLVKEYTSRRANAVRLLHEELDTLSKQRQEIEQRKLDILQEHHFVEKNQMSVLEEEYDIWGTPDWERAKKSTSLHNEIDVGVNVTGEYGTVGYWRERSMRLERLLEDSLKRESILVQKLQDSVKMEEEKLPVEELSCKLKRADNFLHLILQNAPLIIAHQDKDLRYRFVYNHFPSLGEEDVIGKTDEEILSGSEGVKEFQDFKREVLENGKPAKREITYETPLFGKKTFLTYVEPVFKKKREIIGINCMGLEITDLVVKREKLAKYREEMALQKAKETELFKTIHVTDMKQDPLCHCHCGTTAQRKVSRSLLNPGRWFHGCQNWEMDGCNFFKWRDWKINSCVIDVSNELKSEVCFRDGNKACSQVVVQLAREKKKNASLRMLNNVWLFVIAMLCCAIVMLCWVW